MPDDRNARGKPPKKPGAKKEPEGFRSEILSRSVIAIPLLDLIAKNRATKRDVIIDLDLDHPRKREGARAQVLDLLHDMVGTPAARREAGDWPKGLDEDKSELVDQYLFGRLTGEQILDLVHRDCGLPDPAIHRVWPDFELEAHITQSIRTVKCDAARSSFSAQGEDIVWAVMDSGIDGTHPHFLQHGNLKLTDGEKMPVEHKDFTGEKEPLVDEYGHGTHVAGIIAGEIPAQEKRVEGTAGKALKIASRSLGEGRRVNYDVREVPAICGMAPKARLVSLKVLDAKGNGLVSNLITAIAYIQEVNGYGRRLQIHGVNMSVGYSFDPEWFACGQSPLCVEVDRLVRSGVVVVVAAGNTGYGFVQVKGQSVLATAGLDLTINDPGNAEQAITVGATHRDSPYTYGVSYFSSKGPTGDGRVKPDLIAPGEKIVSCAAGLPGREASERAREPCDYREESGTSMAAPHVSGVIAAFLSVRREFIGRPDEVKRIFLDSATDLGRDRYFQGHGLVDLMRAIQSI
jgi:subtilisin family serine protease